MDTISEEAKQLIKDACTRLTGYTRRAYQAEIILRYVHGCARKAEREMGWGSERVQKGLKEAESGIRCRDDSQGRGRKRTEDTMSGLKDDMISLAEPQTQADPAMKSALTETRLTGKAVRKALLDEKGSPDEDLPTENTLGTILNRMGYHLKQVLTSRPRKKIPERDEMFEHVWDVNRQSDENPASLRLSLAANAKLAIGDFSRNGTSRGKAARNAADHEMNPDLKLVPYGILDVISGQLTVMFGTSYETSDCIVDGLEWWWETHRSLYAPIKELVLNLDNGPNPSSVRTQFIRSMTAFSDRTGGCIR